MEAVKGAEQLMQTGAFPVVGKKVIIHRVPGQATQLQVTYQPDAPIAEVVVTDLDSATVVDGLYPTVEWMPLKPGIAKIEAIAADGTSLGTVEHSVKFDGTPSSGVGIFLLAALVLFGGSALSLRLLLRDD